MHRRQLLSFAAASLAGCAVQAPTPTPLAPPAPLLTGQVLGRIAFGACINQKLAQPIWDTVLADRPDLFIFGGDNVYASQQPWSRDRLLEAYATEAAVPGFARLRERIPHMAIWDDHDYGLNDGGAEFAFKHESKSAFLDFWRIPAADPRRSRDGLYHAQIFGPPGRQVQVILLDARWFRSPLKRTDERDKPGKERYLPDTDPAKTMLGQAQWQWLEAQLRQPAQLRLIVSGVQVITRGHGWECWGNFPLEQQRLYRLIASTRAQGLVFLSGDRHFGALYRQAGDTPYPFYELTSSGITHPWTDAAEAGPNRLGELFTKHHYGVVDIDWNAPSLLLAIKDIAGQVQRSRRIPLSELEIKT